jgi:hypothetical protein
MARIADAQQHVGIDRQGLRQIYGHSTFGIAPMRGINGLAIHFDAIHRVIAIQVDDELVDRPHSAEGQRGVALQPSAGGDPP